MMSRINRTKPKIGIRIILFILVVMALINSEHLFAQDSVIKVYCSNEIGQVNKHVFGSSFEGYKTSTKGFYGRIDYGTGVWNPKDKKSVPEVIDLAKEAGIFAIRFNTNNYYDWKTSIGKRNHYLYGIDDFLKTAEEIGAEPIFIIRYVNADVQDAADFVEYLNAPSNGLYPWARARARNGHILPYNVKYFEIGNEIADPKHSVSPEEYAHKYLKYYESMKEIDNSVMLGAVLGGANWNRRIMEVIRDKIDFGIIHIYPTPFISIADKEINEMNPTEIFRLTLAMPIIKSEIRIRKILKLLMEKAGKEIPLAITEHNVGLALNTTIPYRHSLGAALVNAELLRILMKPENNILLANYHQFSNEYWGMVKSEDNYWNHDYRKPIRYIKRPNYYVYELYSRHFGEVLIDTDMKGDSYDVDRETHYMQRNISRMKEGTTNGINLLADKWEIGRRKGVNAKLKKGELEINFSVPQNINYYNAVKRASVQTDTYYRLSGFIKTENLIDNVGISLLIVGGKGRNGRYSIAETERILGTNNWQYVSVIYKTLEDAKSVAVQVRRVGGYKNSGTIEGKVILKNVRLEQINPDTHIPLLSVNASKSRDGNIIYLMVINKSMDEEVTSLVELNDFIKSENINNALDDKLLSVEAWTLNGPSIDAVNESKHNNVKVTHYEVRKEINTFRFTFEPHSLTALEIKRR